ncbi:hypothetical protein IEN85_20505 [Pelagicoccus sp. NFK12]|uniref:Uncharacterized protein n=1 Tax=Pelagicoccus enzymogenes TaxID=2773457 RepID=A0A927FCJ6_9BACT|nr:hypothetical protein [Pelagicoccus enzymogenes]MBD5781894.1 hypothetical protein [Pelagicoccus enzymogenes]
MKSTFGYLAAVLIIGLLSALPYVYKRGFAAGAESAQASLPHEEKPLAGSSAPDSFADLSIPHPERNTSASQPTPTPDRSPESLAIDRKIAQFAPSTPIDQALLLWTEIEALPDGPAKREQRETFLKAFGEYHGEAGFIALLSDEGPNALRSLGPLAAGWARNEPDAAWAALLAASNKGAIRGIDLRSVIAEVSQTDLGSALDMINDLQGNRRDREFRSLANSQQSTEAFQAMLEMSLQIPDDTFRERSMASLFDAWSDFDFNSSLDAINTLPDPSLAKSSMHGLLRSWAQRDGAEAFAYALENQGDPNVEGSLTSVARSWLRSSSAFEVDEVFDALAYAPERDKTLFDLTADLIAADPETTMAMVQEMEDSSLRQRTFSKAIHYWSRNDLDGAETFAFSQGDPTAQASMISTLSRSRMQEGGSLDPYAQAIGALEEQKDRRRALIGLKRNLDSLGTQASQEQAAAVDHILSQYAADMEGVTFMPDGRVRIRNPRTERIKVKTP